MAYSVEPFHLRLVPSNLLSPISESGRDCFWKRPDLIGELHDSQANMLQDVHERLSSILDLNSPQSARF